MNGIVGIIGFSIRNWRMTIGIMLFAVLGGIYAIANFPLDAEPDVPFPFINVRVMLPGISPEDAQRLLIRPMETELKSIEGLKRMDGVAAQSVGYITLEFNASFDPDKTLTDVAEKVDRARSEFPLEAREPIIEEINSNELPVIVVNLFGDTPDRELQREAKLLKRKIEGIPAVLEAIISGERVDVLEAIIDPALVESTGITFDEIASAVARNNSLITAGALETDNGKFNVKLPGLIESPSDLAQLVVRSNPDGSIIRMSDIAEVRRGYKDSTTYARFNGRKSLSIEVSNRVGENLIETIEKIRALVDAETTKPDWPSTINVEYSQDRSIDTRTMVQTLFANIINAVILVFIVCVVALGFRSALFVGWAIPASFLMALFVMYIQGVSINFMILFGLILSVGLLVDSAIVIIEYADRKLAEGLPRREAFQIAGERMFWPIVSSTATTLAAFIPILFWDEITGKFMAYLPLTMIFVLSAALLMALVFLPTLGTLLGPRKISKPTGNLKALSGAEGDPSKLTGPMGVYVRFLSLCIRFPLIVVTATILGFYFLILVPFGASMSGDDAKPVEFFTNTPSDQVYVIARTRGNSTPAEGLAIGIDIENRIMDIEGIKALYTVAGAGAGGDGSANFSGGNSPSDTVVKIYTELYPFSERRDTIEIMDDMRAAVADMPGIMTEIVALSQGPPIGKDIAIQLTSDDHKALKAAVLKVRNKFETEPGLFEIEDTLPLPGVEWELQVNREEAGRLGLDISRIGAAVQFLTEGALVGQFRPLDADEEVDIRIRYPQEARDLSQLDKLRILTPNGALPLSTVVDRVARPQQNTISSRDQQLVYEVKANTREDYATNVQVAEVKKWLTEEADISEVVGVKFLGQEEENAAAAEFFRGAGVAILFMMGIILLLQFNSFYHVALTLLAVILSLFGVLLGLTYYPYLPLVPTIVGVMALAGIVVNNNIVLIDTYQRLKETGYETVDAAIRTAAQRLRPVFLTTATTMVGLFPMVLGWQADIFTGVLDQRGNITSDIFAPISFVIVVGLGFATLLTLVLTPVFLAMPAVLGGRIKRTYRRVRPVRVETDEAEEIIDGVAEPVS